MLLTKVLLSRLSTFWPGRQQQHCRTAHKAPAFFAVAGRQVYKKGLFPAAFIPWKKRKKGSLASPSHGGTDKKLMETSYNTKAFFTRSVISHWLDLLLIKSSKREWKRDDILLSNIRCQSPKYENGFKHLWHLASGWAMNTTQIDQRDSYTKLLRRS